MLECTSCLKNLSLENFYVDKNLKRGYSYTCKLCKKMGIKSSNKTVIFKDDLKWCNSCKAYLSFSKFNFCKKCKNNLRYTCSDCEKLAYKRYVKTESHIEYLNLNRENKNKYNRELYQRSKDRINKRIRDKRRENPLYGLACTLRSNISNKLRKFLSGSKERKTYDILGCTSEYFASYIESKFEPWMNWENRGLYNGELNYGWDLDHIIPINSAKSDEEIYKLNHYTNFQPLCSKVNRDIKWKN